MDLFGGSLARVAPERVVDVEAMTQSGFDGRPEAIGAAGMLPLQVQAHAVEFFLGDALHDPCATGLTALEPACTKGEIIRVRPNQRVRQARCVAGKARLSGSPQGAEKINGALA